MIATSTRATRDSLFLDSGFLIALNAADDQYHQRAVDHWRLLDRATPLVTTTYIVDEVVTFFNSRGRHATAVSIGNLLITSGWVELLNVDEELFRMGWEYFVKHADKRYSLTDCISFVVMRPMGLQEALTFDAHFQQAGFRRVPQPRRCRSARGRPAQRPSLHSRRTSRITKADFANFPRRIHSLPGPRPAIHSPWS